MRPPVRSGPDLAGAVGIDLLRAATCCFATVLVVLTLLTVGSGLVIQRVQTRFDSGYVPGVLIIA